MKSEKFHFQSKKIQFALNEHKGNIENIIKKYFHSLILLLFFFAIHFEIYQKKKFIIPLYNHVI